MQLAHTATKQKAKREAHLLQDTRRIPHLAREEPRQGVGAARRLLQEGVGEAEHHVAGVGRRSALLWLDRRRSSHDRRRALFDSLHTTPRAQYMEQRKHEALCAAEETRTSA